ncbi:MAG: class I SAM-dependent methyltransferase [Candidatus Dojkabacteria bacterium]
MDDLNKQFWGAGLPETRWVNGLSEQYDKLLQEAIPSDIAPYKVAFELIKFYATGGRVLDIGCLNGTNTEKLVAGAEASQVVGIDIQPENVEKANDRYSEREDMAFAYVPENSPIPDSLGKFNAAFAGFVIPTISKIESLDGLIRKTYNALAPGGLFATLQLNPDSLSDDSHYRYYHHSLPSDAIYADGKPFNNSLESYRGEKVDFVDYCWRPETIYRLMNDAGFANIKIVNLRASMNGAMGKRLKAELANMQENFDIKWMDEWSDRASLYQIIYAEKPE